MKKIMALVLAGIMVLGGCTGSTDSASEDTEKDSAQNSSQEVKDVTILTGPSGGTMEIVGAATIELFKAAMPGTEFSSVPSTGSAVNVKLMDNGEAQQPSTERNLLRKNIQILCPCAPCIPTPCSCGHCHPPESRILRI